VNFILYLNEYNIYVTVTDHSSERLMLFFVSPQNVANRSKHAIAISVYLVHAKRAFVTP